MGNRPTKHVNLCSMFGGRSGSETHKMSPRAASCFSATWRSWRGSPSRSRRSFSPYRLPSPRVRFVLSQRDTQRKKHMYIIAGQRVRHTYIHHKRCTHTAGERKRARRQGREQDGGRRAPVVMDLLLDLWHGCLLSLTENSAHVLTIPQAQVCGGSRGETDRGGMSGGGGYIC